MASCPNCGRKTLRTLDWACQWCGYPILSKAYKKIDKTFKELQEERSVVPKPPPFEPAAEAKTEAKPEPEPVYEPEKAAEPVIELGPPPAVELPPPEAPKTERKRKPKAAPKGKAKSAAEPAPEPEPEIKPPPAPEPGQMAAPPPPAEPMITPPPAPATESKPTHAPVIVPNLESLNDGDLLTVDGLDALFRANKLAAHTALTDKTMKVQGIIDKVFIRDHIDVRYLVLRGAQKKLMWPVRCSFGKEIITEMHRLSEGQEITVRGKYDGYGKNIIFKDCVIVS